MRPASYRVRAPRYAHTRVPTWVGYRPYYTRWYCHPWYRYRYSTVAVVGFGFSVYAWHDWWVPPARAGWRWVPGAWSYGYWTPGYWTPMQTAPVGYVYVPGWWENEAYVEGYYRQNTRSGWEWVEGYYLEDGTHVRGHWRPRGAAPEGYLWEPGFWDGEDYVDGFWRPEFRANHYWVSAFYDDDGIYHAGYWVPAEERPGEEWVPGWFDGNEWIPGYWVLAEQVNEQALQDWQPPDGYDDGWDFMEITVEDGVPPESEMIERYRDETGEAPLGVPVIIGEE